MTTERIPNGTVRDVVEVRIQHTTRHDWHAAFYWSMDEAVARHRGLNDKMLSTFYTKPNRVVFVDGNWYPIEHPAEVRGTYGN